MLILENLRARRGKGSKNLTEIYVSVDIEADGPIPGDYSMLSLGSAAYDSDENLISTFTVNIAPLETAEQHPDTVEFWKENPAAWDAVQTDRHLPENAMVEYAAWLEALVARTETRLVFVGYPAVFDFAFVHWYLVHFVGSDPFGYYALDLKTYAMAALDTEFGETNKSIMPKDWLKREHPHIALDDAIEQGEMLFAIRKAIRGG